jgi:hypothetical protein
MLKADHISCSQRVESNTVDKKKKSKKKKQDMEEEKQIDTGNEDGSGHTPKKPKKWTPQEPKSNLVKGNLNLFN